jgi:hypothetical protein
MFLRLLPLMFTQNFTMYVVLEVGTEEILCFPTNRPHRSHERVSKSERSVMVAMGSRFVSYISGMITI